MPGIYHQCRIMEGHYGIFPSFHLFHHMVRLWILPVLRMDYPVEMVELWNLSVLERDWYRHWSQGYYGAVS